MAMGQQKRLATYEQTDSMVVVTDASFGRSRIRSEPFLRRFRENFENSHKPAQKRLSNGFAASNAYTNAY